MLDAYPRQRGTRDAATVQESPLQSSPGCRPYTGGYGGSRGCDGFPDPLYKELLYLGQNVSLTPVVAKPRPIMGTHIH